MGVTRVALNIYTVLLLINFPANKLSESLLAGVSDGNHQIRQLIKFRKLY